MTLISGRTILKSPTTARLVEIGRRFSHERSAMGHHLAFHVPRADGLRLGLSRYEERNP